MRSTTCRLAGLLCVLPVLAQAADGPRVSPWGYLGSSVLVLLFLAGLLLLANWLLRRYGRAPAARAGRLRVVDTVALGPHERLVLVSLDGREMLVGVGQGRVSAIAPPQVSSREARTPGLARTG